MKDDMVLLAGQGRISELLSPMSCSFMMQFRNSDMFYL